MGVYGATILEATSLSLVIYLVSVADSSLLSLVLVVLAFSSVIFLFSTQELGLFSQVLQGAVFQELGRLSYSIYMTHALILAAMFNVFEVVLGFDTINIGIDQDVLVFGWANAVNIALLLMVVLVSAGTYRFIEMPWRDRFRVMAERHR